MDDEYLPAPARPGVYFPDSLILYGVKLNYDTDYGTFSAGQSDFRLRSRLIHMEKGKAVEMTKDDYSIALAYGYGFDGHCYRLDTHRIFIIFSAVDEDAIGCGFDLLPNTPAVAKYRMWRIRSSDELLEITTSFGDAQTLILDANLPGKRSPTSYAIHMAMAHRNGRLARD